MGFDIRSATPGDLELVIALDERITGLAKPEYWRERFDYAGAGRDRFFLAAADGDDVLGFIVGEVRAWEFGSPPCGWVFTIAVDPEARQDGIGSALFKTICRGFRRAGVGKVRTMLSRNDQLVMSFFRSQGMMAGPFTELEMELDQ